MPRWRVNSYLEDVVVLESGRDGNFLRDNKRILEIFVRDVVKLLAMVYQRRNA